MQLRAIVDTFVYSPGILAQVTQTVSLTERWLSGEGGVLGMSLTLNVILLGLCGYLLKLTLKKEAEKTAMMQAVYHEAQETSVEITRAITELATMLRGSR